MQEQLCKCVKQFTCFRRTGCSEKLEELRIRAEESGDFLFATDHEQVWEEVMSLLDTFVEMLGEEKCLFLCLLTLCRLVLRHFNLLTFRRH